MSSAFVIIDRIAATKLQGKETSSHSLSGILHMKPGICLVFVFYLQTRSERSAVNSAHFTGSHLSRCDEPRVAFPAAAVNSTSSSAQTPRARQQTHTDTDYLSLWLITHKHNAAITGPHPQSWLSIVWQRLGSLSMACVCFCFCTWKNRGLRCRSVCPFITLEEKTAAIRQEMMSHLCQGRGLWQVRLSNHRCFLYQGSPLCDTAEPPQVRWLRTRPAVRYQSSFITVPHTHTHTHEHPHTDPYSNTHVPADEYTWTQRVQALLCGCTKHTGPLSTPIPVKHVCEISCCKFQNQRFKRQEQEKEGVDVSPQILALPKPTARQVTHKPLHATNKLPYRTYWVAFAQHSHKTWCRFNVSRFATLVMLWIFNAANSNDCQTELLLLFRPSWDAQC